MFKELRRKLDKKDVRGLIDRITSLMEAGRMGEALSVGVKACELARTKLDVTDAEYVIACSRLATLHLHHGQAGVAELLLLEVVEWAESVLGPKSPEYIAILNNLSLSYQQRGRADEALPLMRRVVELKRAVLGRAHVQNAGNLQDLIKILEELDRAAETEPYVRELAEMFGRELGERNTEHLVMLENLARACLHAGKEDECRELLAKIRSLGGVPFVDIWDDADVSDESSHDELAKRLYAEGDYDGAREVHRKIIDASPSSLMSPLFTNVMGHVFDPLLPYCEEVERKGVQAEEAGDFDLAADCYRQRAEMLRVTFGESHPYVGIALSNLGLVRQKQERFEDAKELFREALIILGNPDKLPEEYNISRNIAAFYWAICEKHAPHPSESFDESMSSMRGRPKDYSRSIRMVFLPPRPGENPVETNARMFVARTRFYESLGDHRRASFLYETALEMMRMVWPDEKERLLPFIQRLAEHRMDHGDFDRADDLMREEAQIVEERFGPESLEDAENLRRRARLLSKLANHVEAEKLIRKAREVVRKQLGDNAPELMALNDDLIVVLMQLGKGEEARELMRVFVDHFAEDPEAERDAADLQQVASYFAALEEYEGAEMLLRRALAMQKEQIGEWDPRYALTLSNLGNTLRPTGRFAEAADCFRRAAEIRRTEFGPDHVSVANSEIRLALSLAAVGRGEEALEAARDVLRIDDLLIADVSAISSQQQLTRLLKQQRLNLNVALALVHRFFQDRPASVREAYELVLRRKGLSAEALAARRLPVLSGRHPRLREKLKELGDITSIITQARLGGTSAEHRALVERAQERKARLEAELSRALPEMRLEQFPNKATVEQIAETLPPEAVLLEYVRIDPHDFKAVHSQGEQEQLGPRYLAFILHAGQPESLRMLDLGEAQAIDDDVAGLVGRVAAEARHGERHLTPVRAGTGASSLLKTGASLREKIIDPLSDYFGGRKKLLVVPDGPLFLLPFDILPLDSGGHLIDEFSLSFLGAGRDVLRLARQADVQHTSPVVVAGADFDMRASQAPPGEGGGAERPAAARSLRDAGIRFAPLPGAEEEGREVSSLLQEPRLLTKAEAVASAIRELESPVLLHLATHGFFLPERVGDEAEPEETMITSGLALSGANAWLGGETSPGGIGDGILTAEDVATLNLLETDLVVLSACQSGLGVVVVGEGVFGLRRAFFAAGARTTIMSLWQAPDHETKELMLHFYSALSRGASKAEALRGAKLELRRSYPHPFYWGSFICEGDWRASREGLFTRRR